MPRLVSRLKAGLHPLLDPVLSMPQHWQTWRALRNLPSGAYRAVEGKVPYYPQFASPNLIYDYIHNGYDGTQDPNWQVFGASDPAEYAFWSHRVCTLAVIKMAAEAFDPTVQPTLWQLVKEGLAADGYTVRDERGRWVDEGWYFHAQVHLARRYGLLAEGESYVSPLNVCQRIHAGWLVAASVTPELGEREPSGHRYGGHLVLVHGFEWAAGQGPTAFTLHNPSGRCPELQGNAVISAERFAASFAYRLVAFRPAAHRSTGQ
ncbi:MAG: hypothetical protein GYB65_04770 [Chloroflexi bacterium]|nr:hypothetical protein [Chloroflexota bacterium]